MKQRFYGILLVLMILISAGAYLLTQSMPRFSLPVLLSSNVILFLLSVVSFTIVHQSFSERPQAFVRGVTSGSLIKLFVCAGGVLIYALLNRSSLYKPQLFVLMGMYLLYSLVENVLLSRMAKGNH